MLIIKWEIWEATVSYLLATNELYGQIEDDIKGVVLLFYESKSDAKNTANYT